jgi:casein kinase 1
MDDSLKHESKKLTLGTVIAGKYKLLEKIGAGSFGSVFKT